MSKKTGKPNKGGGNEVTKPPDVLPRYQAMAHWKPRNMRKRGRGGK